MDGIFAGSGRGAKPDSEMAMLAEQVAAASPRRLFVGMVVGSGVRPPNTSPREYREFAPDIVIRWQAPT